MATERDREWARAAAGGRVYDLGRELSPDVPHHPNHSPMMHRLHKLHGDVIDEYGMSASNDIIAMGTHIGTHIDGLAHVSVDGCLAGGVEAATIQDRLSGFGGGFGMQDVAPIVLPAVVVDPARVRGEATLSDDHLITAAELERTLEEQDAAVPEGGAILFRTGWGAGWPHVAHAFRESPGPGTEAVDWAWDRGARLFGSDTAVFERLPAEGLPVHRALIADRGAHIVELMDLEEICADGAWEFLLVLAPLKLRGGTGSPLRPVGIAAPSG